MTESLPSTNVAPSRAVIDLAAFRNNVGIVRSFISPGTKILAMIKANAYGHGLLEIAAEAKSIGVDFFGVARLEEGLSIRHAGFMQRILLVEPVKGPRAEAAILGGLEITVTSFEDARELANIAERLGKQAEVHVEVDTGMGRIGMQHPMAADEIELLAQLRGVVLRGVFSHFATSEDPDQSFAREQLACFNAVLDDLEIRGVTVPLRHIANSGAIMTLPESHFDMVRPGIMLYGYPPSDTMGYHGLRPVLSLVSSVCFLKTVAPGTSISYGRRYYTEHKSRIATVLIGYGDGVVRALSSLCDILINGKRYPVVGTICMDMIMVDVGMDSNVKVGDTATLIGQDGDERITAWDVCRRLKSIPYEVTCLITSRVQRVYTDSLEDVPNGHAFEGLVQPKASA